MKRYIVIECNFDVEWFYCEHKLHETKEGATEEGTRVLEELQSEYPDNETFAGCVVLVREIDIEDERDFECPNEIPDGYEEP